MARLPKQKIEVYPTDENGNISGTPTELTGLLNIQVMKGINETKDTFSFEVPIYKSNGEWQNTFGNLSIGDKTLKINDIIVIKARYSTDKTWDDDHLLIMGNIRKFTYVDSAQRCRVKVTGINRTEELLKGMVPYTTYGTTTNSLSPNDIIIDIFKRANAHNPNHKIYVKKTNETIDETGTSGGIVTERSQAYEGTTAFPEVEYTSTWKPIHIQLEELSKTSYTNDENAGQYIFYVKPIAVLPEKTNPADKNGPYADVLYWEPVGTTYSGSIIEGNNITNINITHDIRDVVNAAIVNAGVDLNGAGILTVAYDLDSMSKHGAKWVFYTKTNKTFQRLQNNEIEQSGLQGSTFDATTGFPTAGDFPWNFQYDLTAGDSAADEEEYNKGLRDKAKSEAEADVLSVLSFLKKPRYDCVFDLELGSNEYTMGNVYYFQIPSFGWDGTETNPGKLLRLRDETHLLGASGWQTRITAKEDEDVVQQIIEETN